MPTNRRRSRINLPQRLRDSARQARAIDRSKLLEEAAKEIEKLYVCIDCYSESSALALAELSRLREAIRNDAAAESSNLGGHAEG